MEAQLQKSLADLERVQQQRASIEKQIDDYTKKLNGLGVNRSESLVDDEGYPRGDIDIHAAREIRVTLIRLENDLVDVNEQLQAPLNSVFQLKRAIQQAELKPNDTNEQDTSIDYSKSENSIPDPNAKITPIAKIRQLSSEGIGAVVGFAVDDQFVKFGKATNLATLANELKAATKESPVDVRVYRPVSQKYLDFKVYVPPGKSLGCHIVPV